MGSTPTGSIFFGYCIVKKDAHCKFEYGFVFFLKARMSIESLIDSILNTFAQWLYSSILGVADFLAKCRWTYENTKWGPTKKNPYDMHIEIWQIRVADGISGAIHGAFYKITEFYFPELNFSYNIANGNVNYLLDSKKRYKYKTRLFYKDGQPILLEKTTISGPLVHSVKDAYRQALNAKQNEAIIKELSQKLLSDLKIG